MTAIDALAEAFGIEADFVDAHGETQRTSAETKRSLIEALGADAADEDAARRALESLERGAWLRALPPVLVHAQANTLTVPLTLPAATDTVTWRLRLENGRILPGTGAFAALNFLESRSIDGRRVERRSLCLNEQIPLGYHQLEIDGADAAMMLIVTPPACVLPERLRQRNGWGVAVQLYALRADQNWGIGDFSDLQRLTGILGVEGADVIGLNPLHALFLDEPEHASPYSPASRLLLNAFYIDVTKAPGFHESAARRLFESDDFQEQLAACRAASHVQYAAVCELKLAALRLVYSGSGSQTDCPAFFSFIREGGEGLRAGCLFQVLRDHFIARSSGLRDWRSWPADFQNPNSAAVRSFEAEHDDELRFQYWLQWVADQQLAGAAAAASTAAMRIGLYRDLAVGSDPNGVEAWSNPTAVIQAASAGAPPDILNPNGQNWGLPPFHPTGLVNEAYQSFIALVRSNMRHAGAIRIDHVMALQHLYVIPANAQPAAGAYIRYPLDDLIGILALESTRNTCLVIGEDLGTVPAGFRERMAAANILSYRVLFFEKTADGAFMPPPAYPQAALAVVGSHDLATLCAWLEGADIALRVRIGTVDETEAAKQREQREADRTALVTALVQEELLPDAARDDAEAIVTEAHAFLARSPAVLVMAQLDDITGEIDPVNVPTTTDEYLNWRRRISIALEDLASREQFTGIADAFTAAGRANA
jgi:glycogen operon protein